MALELEIEAGSNRQCNFEVLSMKILKRLR